MKKLIECVPNFSEGRDQNVIRQITDAIESVDGVSLLDVDPGASTNRTVVTFVGDPEATVEAAFRGIKVVIPVDGMSAENTYFEQYTAYHMANAPGVGQQTTITRIDMIK